MPQSSGPATFLTRLATPYFCPVPVGTSYVGGGPFSPHADFTGPITSSGPFYVADANNGHWVELERNPNYAGARPVHLQGIVIRENIGLTRATKWTQFGELDGITAPHPRAFPRGDPRLARWRDLVRQTDQSLTVTRAGSGAIAQLIGPRIGCRRYSTAAAGIDLAAICLRSAR